MSEKYIVKRNIVSTINRTIELLTVIIFLSISCSENSYLEPYNPDLYCGKTIHEAKNQGCSNEVFIRLSDNKLEYDHGSALSTDWRPGGDFYIDMYEYPNTAGQLPVVNVEFNQAQQLCQAVGKRVCFIDEWREVCRGNGSNTLNLETDGMHGPKGYNYPYGGDGTLTYHKQGWCNDDSSGVAVSGAFSNCRNIKVSSNMNTPYDMTGNVYEWVDNDFYGYQPTRVGQGDCTKSDGNPANGDECQDSYVGYETRIGGYYFEAEFATCNRNMILPITTNDEKTGFRCCRN